MAGLSLILIYVIVNISVSTIFIEAWSRNICSTVKSRTEYYTYCYYRNWAGVCCGYRRGVRTVKYTEYFCCPGWTHNGNEVCDIAICSPNCFYDGTCDRPNHCICKDGRKGQFCMESQCASYIKPCYPGYCDTNNNCQCVQGYSGSSCLTFSDPALVPNIDKCQTKFSYFHAVKNMVLYSYYTDATGKTNTETVWTNQPAFNRLQFSFQVMFDTKFTIPVRLTSFPPRPDYIQSFGIGITEAKIHMTHYEYRQITKKHEETFICSDVSGDNPLRDRELNCTIQENSYVPRIDSGDVLTFTYMAKSGGFRELINRDTGSVTNKEYYTGRTDSKVMEFRVDFDAPTHCQEAGTCSLGELSLDVHQDITKSSIQTRWSGWNDRISGMYRYAWEIFKLRPDYKDDLTEFGDPDPITNAIIPPKPIINVGILRDGRSEYSYSFTPDGPGMYSIVLEAADAANNTRYARRLVLYDPISTVTIHHDKNSRMYASSAAAATGNIWQNIVNKIPGGKTNVTIVWPNHFANRVHKDGKFLNRVLGFKSYLDDGDNRINYKFIPPNSGLDDNEGARTKIKIPNYHGIVKFEIAYDYDETGGSTIKDNGLIWNNVSTFSEEDTVQKDDVNDGGTMKVSVRATDIMNNTNIDSTLIHFDSTEPTISTPSIKKNIKGAFPFSSRITVRTEDRHSGIFEIRYKFIADDTKMVKHTGSFKFPKRTDAECRTMPCYRVNMGDQFAYETSFDINHCWLMVPKEKLDDQVINLEIESVNPAMLTANATLQLRNIRGFDGIEAYFSPINVTVKSKTDTGIKITWSHAPTCHNRTEIIIKLVLPSGEESEYKVHKDATSFAFAGLTPETIYTIMIYNMFGNIRSEASTPITTSTGEYKGLRPGAVAGIVIGVLIGIILIVLIVSVICWRTNRMPEPIHKMVDRPFSVVFKTEPKAVNDYTDHAKTSKSSRKQVYSANLDEDVYYWAGQMSERIPRRQITLEEEIARGKFAIIYRAKYNRHGNDADTVVAKVLHDTYTEEDKVLMDAKINFMTTVVGSHPNILQLIGAVDDPTVGPMMILEYCETGTLKDYLRARKDKVDEHVMEKLFRFGFDICKGMEYLASINIVHRKLAARNVLLTFIMEVKISGFGPMPVDDDKPDSDKKEMIPIKWIAPECILHRKAASEKGDVWSYGVTLWEIFTLGDTPYPNIRSRDIHSRLMQGQRLSKPEHCDDVFHGIMKKCWQKEAKKRPTFKKIKDEIEQLFVSGPDNDYYYEQGHLYDNRQ